MVAVPVVLIDEVDRRELQGLTGLSIAVLLAEEPQRVTQSVETHEGEPRMGSRPAATNQDVGHSASLLKKWPVFLPPSGFRKLPVVAKRQVSPGHVRTDTTQD